MFLHFLLILYIEKRINGFKINVKIYATLDTDELLYKYKDKSLCNFIEIE
jgi:hypothetical protein